jgi:hypothetical protein
MKTIDFVGGELTTYKGVPAVKVTLNLLHHKFNEELDITRTPIIIEHLPAVAYVCESIILLLVRKNGKKLILADGLDPGDKFEILNYANKIRREIDISVIVT